MNTEVSLDKIIDISELDEKEVFLHYTNKNNIDNIFKFGLEARIGKNSMFIEKSPKIFFTIGFENTLILMDVWIKWLVLRPKNNFIYGCGAFFMTKSYFPKFIVDNIFKNWIRSQKRINRACHQLNKILKESVFVILNLEENIDFRYDDKDEVKKQKFSRKQLKYIYSYNDSAVDSSKMEFWNMHTLTEKTIESDKIKLLKIGNSCCANELVQYMVEKSKLNFKEDLPFFNKYMELYIKK